MKTGINGLLWVVLFSLVACAPANVQVTTTTTATTVPTATTAVIRPSPTAIRPTPTAPPPTATKPPAPLPTPSPTVAAFPTPQSRAVAYNGVHFTYDLTLGDVYTSTESMGAVDFTRFSFAAAGLCREIGCVDVYPVAEYQAAFSADYPMPPVGAATILRAQNQALTFQNGNGARSLRMRGQNGFFANNEALVYDFQGYSDDGRYYVSIIFPIDAPILLSTADPHENSNPAAIPVPAELPDDYSQLGAVIQEYNQEVERQLDLLAATDFTPGLDVLDGLVASLTLEPPPDEDAPPPTTEEPAGPFRLVAPMPPELSGDVISLRVAPGGRLWAATTNRFAVWGDGQWQAYPPTDFRISDMLPASSGNIWLAHNRGVYIFDGARWTTLTPADMGMNDPLDPDYYTPYVLEQAGSQVWVGRCDWGGPGPAGGGGARWFDGTTWQGSDSPVADGCVTAIREDDQGNVWVSLDADLWRYDPAADAWERFAPPQPPEGFRFGYITDLAVDPDGEPWPSYALCGGASCVVADLRYRLHAGEWIQIGEPASYRAAPILLFDGAGTPWLFGDIWAYRVEGDQLSPVTGLAVTAAVVDEDGRLWAAGTAASGTGSGVWFFDPAGDVGAETAVCPVPASSSWPSWT